MPILEADLGLNTPPRIETVRDMRRVRVLPTSAVGFASAQATTQNVPLTMLLDGPMVMNAQTRDSAGNLAASTTAGDLAEPSDLWFTATNVTDEFTGIVEGIDHRGIPVYVEFTKLTGGTGGIFMLAQSQVTITKNGDTLRGIPARTLNSGGMYVCFSSIQRIVITRTSAAASSVSIGPLNNGAIASRMPRIPLPVPIEDVLDLTANLVLLSTGGATVTTPAAVPGRVAFSTSVFGNGDIILPLVAASAGMVETASPAGSNAYEWGVGYRAGRMPGL